tara:strand:- start:3445 stop:3615 length:171 start_codon:yes stop_codon:yes gene_type:complete
MLVDPEREQDLRDWFAGLAMQGLLQSFSGDVLLDEELMAKRSYEIADAMMEVRDDT